MVYNERINHLLDTLINIRRGKIDYTELFNKEDEFNKTELIQMICTLVILLDDFENKLEYVRMQPGKMGRR